MVLFLRRDSKGPGAVWTYPCVRKIKDGMFEATYADSWRRRRYTYTCHVICRNLSFTTCSTSNFSPIDIGVIMKDYRVLFLVICNVHCAMLTTLVQMNS